MYVDPSEKLVFSRLGFQVQIKVFGTDTDRSVTYNDVVWVVDSEYGPISYFLCRFRDKQLRFRSKKNENFSSPSEF